jgi:hypothetical protein
MHAAELRIRAQNQVTPSPAMQPDSQHDFTRERLMHLVDESSGKEFVQFPSHLL